MKYCFHRFWLWPIVLGFISFQPAKVAAEETPPIRIATQVTNKGRETFCLLAVSNLSTDRLESVNVAVFKDGAEQLKIGPIDLSGRQSTTLRVKISDPRSCDGLETFFAVGYQRSGVKSETIISQKAPARSSGVSGTLLGIAGTLFGFLSGIASLWITHWLTVVRERRKAQMDKFQQVEGALNSFLLAWNGSTLPQELQVHFSNLQRQVVLDEEALESYREILRILSNQQSTTDVKTVAAARLGTDLRRYLERLNPDSRAA